MKHIIALAALFMTSCAPTQTHNVAQAIPMTHESRIVNVAYEGTVKSDGGWNQHFATDGDIDTWWTARDFAPQWIDIDLRHLWLVDKIELIVAQVSPGPATPSGWKGRGISWSGTVFDLAADGDVFALRLDPPHIY